MPRKTNPKKFVLEESEKEARKEAKKEARKEKNKQLRRKIKNKVVANVDKVGKIVTTPIRRANSVYHKTTQKFGVAFWIFILLAFCLGFVFIFRFESLMKIIISDHGYWGILGLSFITDLLVQPVGPDIPLIIGVINGSFNIWLVYLFVLIGSWIALLCSYFIGKKIGAAGIEKFVGTKTFKKIQGSKFHGKVFLLIGALTPIPYIPYLAGMWNLEFKEVLLWVAIPRTIRFFIVFILTYFLGVGMLNLLMA